MQHWNPRDAVIHCMFSFSVTMHLFDWHVNNVKNLSKHSKVTEDVNVQKEFMIEERNKLDCMQIR